MEQDCQSFQASLIFVIKTLHVCTVDINNPNNLFRGQQDASSEERSDYPFLDFDRHDNLTFRAPVTSDMPREGVHIRHHLSLPISRCDPTNASPKRNPLTGNFTLKWAKDQGVRI